MKYIVIIAALFSLTACNSNHADSTEQAKDVNKERFDTPMEKDALFCAEAAAAGLTEVQLGELALSKSGSERVKDFGRSMKDDHGTANSELKDLASKKGIAIPATLDDKGQDAYDDLNKKSGEEFDKAYIDKMVKDHELVVKKFREEADDGEDADIKAWAATKVPVLEHHLQMARDLRNHLYE